MILILTNKQDVHADEVIRRFNKSGTDVFRLNSEDLICQYTVNADLSKHNELTGYICDVAGRKFNLADVRVGWLRKPVFDFFDRSPLSEEERVATSEAKAFIECLYALDHIFWVNDPFRSNRAKVKLPQLILAAKLGMKIPPTVITNEPEIALSFSERYPGDLLTKSIYAASARIDGREQSLLSCMISARDLLEFKENISVSPTLLQKYINKSFELRVTVFENEVFAVKIDSQNSPETSIDWRANPRICAHTVYDLPLNVSTFCLDFLRKQELTFGAMDFIVDPAGEIIFLENNPFGQYLWLELETGLPMTEAMCSLLLRKAYG